MERWIWSRPQSEIPKNLEELEARMYEFADLCNNPDTIQNQQLFNAFHGTPDPLYGNERRGGLRGRFYLAASNGGEPIDGINGRKQRHAAELPIDWGRYPGTT